MQVILISGKSGHGKDTFAQMLREHLEDDNQKVLTIHFGDPVKWIAKDFYNWDGDKSNVVGRALLQNIGTTLMRSYDSDYWARIIGEFVAAAIQNGDFDWVLVPDARFPNEIDVVKQYCPDALAVRVERYDGANIYENPVFTEEQLNHVSETSLDQYNFDYIIENHDLTMLRQSAIMILDDIKKES